MFGRTELKPGTYAFAVQKDGDYSRLIIGRIQSVNGSSIHIVGTYIRPQGLIDRVKAGKSTERMAQVLSNPDPNNCIFMLIDRVETGRFNEPVDQSSSRVIWINENRYLVLDGWIKENFPDVFSSSLSASTEEERIQARSVLLEKMNSLYERDLKDHVYAVARSAKLL
jgi:hypothetical protein